MLDLFRDDSKLVEANAAAKPKPELSEAEQVTFSLLV